MIKGGRRHELSNIQFDCLMPFTFNSFSFRYNFDILTVVRASIEALGKT
jgi:hypothetical protein